MDPIQCPHCQKWIGPMEVHQDCARKTAEKREPRERAWLRAVTPEQRDAVINALDEAWSHFPNLRLGQLIENAVGYHQGAKTFYVEDHALIDALNDFVAKHSGAK